MAQTRMVMDRQTERKHYAVTCPHFKNGHIHTVIKFHQYFPIGYQLSYDITCTKFVESMLDKSSYEVGHVMVLYSPDWTNIGFSFILLIVNLFRHPTLIQHEEFIQNY